MEQRSRSLARTPRASIPIPTMWFISMSQQGVNWQGTRPRGRVPPPAPVHIGPMMEPGLFPEHLGDTTWHVSLENKGGDDGQIYPRRNRVFAEPALRQIGNGQSEWRTACGAGDFSLSS